jgi:DNA primase
VRGLSTFGAARLRVNVRVDQDERFHVDTFDLYSARSRRHFLDEVAATLCFADVDARELQSEVARRIERLESERLALRAKGKGDTPQQQAMSERDEAMDRDWW